MNYSIIHYRWYYPWLQFKFPHSKVSRFQDSKIPKFQKFQSFKVTKLPSFKVSRFQDFKISRFQDPKISRFPNFQTPTFPKFYFPQILFSNNDSGVSWSFWSNLVYANSPIRVPTCSENPKIMKIYVFGILIRQIWIWRVPQEAE